MTALDTTYVILLRAIGPATHRLMSMGEWREGAEAAGFGQVETVLNTGNMVVTSDEDAEAIAAKTSGILRQFGLGENVVPIVRRASVLQGLVEANPIAEAARERPTQTGVYFFADPRPDFAWVAEHDGPELVHVIDHHLIVDFARDVALSGRLIRRIDKACGLNTARNWNTTRKLAERAAAWGRE